jgi:hypothetical protein
MRSVEDGMDYVSHRGFCSTFIVTNDMREIIGVDHPDEYRCVYLSEFPVVSMKDGTRWVNMPDLKAFMDYEWEKWNLGIADLVYPHLQG